jgi:hypothetical protein
LDWTQQDKQKGRKKWKLAYKASIDGFDSEEFHKLCDGKGPRLFFYFFNFLVLLYVIQRKDIFLVDIIVFFLYKKI